MYIDFCSDFADNLYIKWLEKGSVKKANWFLQCWIPKKRDDNGIGKSKWTIDELCN